MQKLTMTSQSTTGLCQMTARLGAIPKPRAVLSTQMRRAILQQVKTDYDLTPRPRLVTSTA